MARLTQRHQVAKIITAAARHGNDMVYLLNRSEPTLFQTYLAQRVSRNVPFSYLTPRSAVFLVAVSGANEFIVAAIHLLCVFLAVLSVTSVGTAGVGTGALWSSGHGCHLLKSNDSFFFDLNIVRYYYEFFVQTHRKPCGFINLQGFLCILC